MHRMGNNMDSLKFNSLIPELSVTDIAATRHFYVDILGFEIYYERKENNFIFVKYENNQLMLDQLNGHWSTGPMEYPFGRGINFEMTVSDVETLYQRILKHGIKPFAVLHTEIYKCGTENVIQKQFLVQDPDGYLLRFVD